VIRETWVIIKEYFSISIFGMKNISMFKNWKMDFEK
jgi:hypothetical protein